ncbi:MAG: rhomboid family intramembrane serine protease [Nibricoccus sp.]
MAPPPALDIVYPMSAPESPMPSPSDPFPEGSMDAGIYPTYADAFEHSLVLLAMGATCWLVTTPLGHHLRIEPSASETAAHQLALFDREKLNWPPAPTAEDTHARQFPLSPLLWVISILAVYWAQGEQPQLTDDWLLDSQKIFLHGEAWRAATALWLHSDIGHLVANALNGVMVFTAVVVTFGLRSSWALIGLSAFVGNLASAFAHLHEDYRSLGSSTAIFAALGLLVGRAVWIAARSGHPHRIRTIALPLCAGLVVLSLFGAGGVQVDILAHATGFVSGLLFGFAAVALKPKRSRTYISSVR